MMEKGERLETASFSQGQTRISQIAQTTQPYGFSSRVGGRRKEIDVIAISFFQGQTRFCLEIKQSVCPTGLP